MNNTQLYLSIGIPTLTVIITWLDTHAAMNRICDKLDKMTAEVITSHSPTLTDRMPSAWLQ